MVRIPEAPRWLASFAIVGTLIGSIVACQPEPEKPALGPVDGEGLAATDLERIQAGDMAPDFSLVSLAGDTITLSQFRGEKNVVLAFYRGHW